MMTTSRDQEASPSAAPPPPPSYVDLLEYDRTYKRQSWVLDYLREDDTHRSTLRRLLSPIEIGKLGGSTRVFVVDLIRNDTDGFLKKELHSNPESIDAVKARLATSDPNTKLRLVFVSSTSGVSAQQRQWQLDRKGTSSKPDAPVLTTPRRPGGPRSHAILDHIQRLPDPGAIRAIAEANHPHPEMLLRFLDCDKHLSYRARSYGVFSAHGDFWGSPDERVYVQVGVDPANHMIAMVEHDTSGDTYTVLILATEDNFLGIDANPRTPGHLQPLRQMLKTPSEAFEQALERMTDDACKNMAQNPLSFVSLYTSSLVSAFAAHVELYQRYWDIKFEPFANTSAVYGYVTHRDAARHFAMEMSTQLRYIKHSIDSIQRVSTKSNGLEDVLKDFEYFEREISTLKHKCDQFLEQQVTKLALQDTRIQMQEARDLKRITYLAFVFVPLSLVSSFFGMNVKELDSGSTPVWVFAVTALAILATSLGLAWLAGSDLLKRIQDTVMRSHARIKGVLVKYSEATDPEKMPSWMETLPGGRPVFIVEDGSQSWLPVEYDVSPARAEVRVGARDR